MLMGVVAKDRNAHKAQPGQSPFVLGADPTKLCWTTQSHDPLHQVSKHASSLPSSGLQAFLIGLIRKSKLIALDQHFLQTRLCTGIVKYISRSISRTPDDPQLPRGASIDFTFKQSMVGPGSVDHTCNICLDTLGANGGVSTLLCGESCPLLGDLVCRLKRLHRADQNPLVTCVDHSE